MSTDYHPAPIWRAGQWQRVAVLMAIVAAVVVAVAVLSGVGSSGASIGPDGKPDTGPLAARVDPLLPDLAMGPIEDIAVGTTDVGDQRLRFAATIVNLGEGPFLVRAGRSFPFTDDWTVSQLIMEKGGGYTERQTGATLVFGGDGHGHWHVKHVEQHRLETLDGEILGSLVKQGFCFFDTDHYRPTLPGSPEKHHWSARGCATEPDTAVRMGLSVGWGDKYPWHLLDERISVTGVPDGRYIVRQIADPNNEFEESDETNNETWAEIEMLSTADGLRTVTVVREGPAP